MLKWKRESILRKKDWTIDEKQLSLELQDFDNMTETLQAMINNVFWLWKMYFWNTEKVEKLWNKRRCEIEREYIDDIILYDIKNLDTKEEIVEYLKD